MASAGSGTGDAFAATIGTVGGKKRSKTKTGTALLMPRQMVVENADTTSQSYRIDGSHRYKHWVSAEARGR